MKLTASEEQFLTALLREQSQAGCRGPAHDLLKTHGYPGVPRSGPGSLAFAYDVVPLSSLVLQPLIDLEQIDDFLRNGERIAGPEWPWTCADEFRSRLDEAKRFWQNQEKPKRGLKSNRGTERHEKATR
jgi:hypothetical protein